MTEAERAALSPIERLAWDHRASGYRLLRPLLDRDPQELLALEHNWALWRRPAQAVPTGAWRTWLVMAGRGFGKTRIGAEWVRAIGERRADARIALVGATREEVRRVMVEGESGILSIGRPAERPTWEPSLGRLRWRGGAQAFVYSAAEPEGLRGPQHSHAWADEIAKWADGVAAWDNLVLTLRLGTRPRIVATTTPRPTALIRRLVAEAEDPARGVVIGRGATRDNRAHLAGDFVAAVTRAYGGSRLGRQELDGELIDDVAGALWTRRLLDEVRGLTMPAMLRVVVGVDPPAGVGADACGIVAVGLSGAGDAWVLEDASVAGASPAEWAAAVAGCFRRHEAHRVIAEANQGGEMVRAVLRNADHRLPITLTHATQGKAARAEPVAVLYEQGRAFHAGAFPALEDELCGIVAGGGYQGPGRSPDRADALVWAMTELMLSRRGTASIRALA